MLAVVYLCTLLAADAAPGDAPSFDFDLLAPASASPATSPAVDPVLAEQASKRRTMLNTHQILGLSTLGLMAATVVLGQLNYNDLYTQAGGHTGDYIMAKRILGYTTAAGFAATASFSLFAPEPYDKPDEGVDTATIHKIAVGVASAGMVTQIVLGFITGRYADAGNKEHLGTLAKAHQIVGYTTFGAMTTAAAIWVF